MFQETPIYKRLLAERGDVPTEVRHEAERIHRELARVITPGPPPTPPTVATPQYHPDRPRPY